MSVKLLTEHHILLLSLKKAAQACLSLHMSKCHIVRISHAGFIQASLSKIQGLLKAFPIVFKDLKLMKNTDLSVKIQLQKC